ncbi:hypothetical protein [Mesobacillus zeae]|uniref:hypothetical protein n=1 Tax=Mesobacillus zeae TaxID=1917180 RepID=UPI003009FF43
MTKTHLIADESLGGVLREYIEVDREAIIGDYVVVFKQDVCIVTDDISIAYRLKRPDGKELCGLFEAEDVTALDPTDIVHVWITAGDLKGLVRYRLVERKAEVGEKVLDLSDGEILEINNIRGDGRRLYDESAPIWEEEYRVLIPVNFEPAEPTPDIHDILANLAARVHDLESQLRDTQGNVERQGAEIETVKHLAKSNEEDIRLLDERTQPKINELTLTSRIDGTTKIDAKYSGIPTSEVLAKILDGGWGR